MQPTFKTEEDLSQRLAKCSEPVRVDYYRRFEQASVAALSAHLEKEQASQVGSLTSRSLKNLKKVNLFAGILLFVLSVGTLVLDLPYGQGFSWFTATVWMAYVGVHEFFFLPNLQLLQVSHWNRYQIHAREWSVLLGHRGFAEHMATVAAAYNGEAPDDADVVDLCIRGLALIHAERAGRQ